VKLSNIPIKCSPEGVNSLLLEKWGIGLFRFAQVFAVSPVDQFLKRTEYPFSSHEIKEIRRNLRAMGDDILKRGRSIFRITGRLKEPPTSEISDDELIKLMKLEKFFKEYVRGHRVGLRYIEKVTLQGRRGSGINKRTIIALGWGNMISESGRRIDWRMLGSLYDWLWEKLAPYGFYTDLEPPSGLEEDLRRQYNRYRWPGGAANYIVEKSKIEESQVLEFLANFISHQFFGGQEGYFDSKISLEEFPKLFMNFFIDAFLGTREGLALFSKNQSLADPMFLFMYFRLQKMIDEGLFPGLKGMNPAGVVSSKDADWPYKTSEIDEYFRFVVSLFLDHKVDLEAPPPLIVFPDRSYFSTSL
jgi:hypothetical protein